MPVGYAEEHTDSRSQLRSSTLKDSRKKLRCTQCSCLLGFEDESANGWRLGKSGISVKTTTAGIWEVFSVETFVCSQLFALIEAHATRRFVLHSGLDDHSKGLFVREGDAGDHILR